MRGVKVEMAQIIIREQAAKVSTRRRISAHEARCREICYP